jgi:glycosyltransferase involved in cell wall biosynthesis
MRIGMILGLPFPPDVRVEKEAKALTNAGFEVGLLAQLKDPQEPIREQTTYGLNIYREMVSQPLWERNIKGWTLIESSWMTPIQKFIREFKPDILHVHDFPLVYSSWKLANPKGIPVVADLHENMPAAYRIWRANLDPLRRMRDSIFRNYYVWRWHERRVLPLCDRIIVVVPEAAERLLHDGIPEEKIAVVSNTEDVTTFGLEPPDPQILSEYRDEWVVSYVGGGGAHRGLDTTIRAVPLASREISSFKLLVVGIREKWDLSALKKLIKQNNVRQQVEILGWQPFKKISSYIAASAVCLVPHNDSEHTQTTVPHKLFQYMILGKPVVVSDVRPLKRIVQDSRSGLVFKANDSTSLANCLIQLYRDPVLRETLGENGHRAALSTYSWKNDAQRLVQLYQEIVSGKESR